MDEPLKGRRLVLLRHGRTEYNATGRVQGQLDVDLDHHGRAQAARTAPVLAALGPAVLWSSDLARARQTAEPLAAAAGLTAVHDPRLREFSFGGREGLTTEQYRAIDPAEHDALRAGRYERVPAAEETAAVAARMHEGLTALLGEVDDGQTAIAVSHGAAIRVAVGALLGWAPDAFHTLRGLSNCGWVVLGTHPEDGSLRLDAYHRTVDPLPDDPDFTP